MTDVAFPPVSRSDARVLILGSMPGQASLTRGQYYAHPRNRFWPLLAEILDFDPGQSYSARCTALMRHGVALWDVIAECRRPGSLDADIEIKSIKYNDFSAFFKKNSCIDAVLCNGAAAARHFDRLRKHSGPEEWPPSQKMPSTSPANAAWNRQRLTSVWRPVLRDLLVRQDNPTAHRPCPG